MTKIIIDLSDALDEFHPDDKVVVWSPAHREGARGQVVNTRPKRIPLSSGKAEEEVEPGPLMVKVQCMGLSDTQEKEVVVPDQETVTLWDLLEQDFTYTPPVISEVSEARAEVREAVARVGTAEQVGQWAEDAQTAETNASTAASDALTIKNSIPATVQSEVDTRVPPKVAEVIAGDTVVTDAAAAAVDARLLQSGDEVRRIAGMRETEPQGNTAWAHITENGTRLPLGYDTTGHLDSHAKKVFREDITSTYQDTEDKVYAHVVTTEHGHLLAGVKRDGSVEIPGLDGVGLGVEVSSGMKLVPLAFSLPGGSSTQSGSQSLRIVRKYAHFPGRVRVHISNRHPVSGNHAPEVSILGSQIGVGADDGTMSSAQELFPADSVIPGDGTELISRWITLDGADGDGLAVSLAWSGDEVRMLKGGCWVSSDTTAWDDETTTGWGWRDDVPLYIWVEAEVPAYVPVVMVNGDSISVGSVTDNPVSDAWVAMYSRAQKSLPVFASWHGSSMWQWAPDTGQWDRLYPGMDLQPDALIMAHGQNDLGSTSDLAVLQERYHTLRDVYDAHFPGVPVYVGTVNASNKDEAKEEVRRDFNAWLKSLPRGERGALDFAAVLDDPTGEFLRPDYTDDTLHPNTAGQSVMAEVALAHPVTPLVPTGGQIATLGGHSQAYDVYELSGFLVSGTTITAGWGSIMRDESTVTLSIQGLATDKSGAVTLFTLPEGFRPINQIVFETVPYWSSETRETGRLTAGGAIEFRSLSVDHRMNLSLTYLTDDPQPMF